jgi:TolB-like protein
MHPAVQRPLRRAPGLRLLPVLVLAACQLGTPVTTPEPTPKPVDPAVVAAREALRREATIDVGAIPERAIAVPPLTVRSADTALAPLGYGLADMLMTDLAHSAQVVVVERSRLDAMLRELQLVQAGQVDSTQAPRVGRLLGARRLVVGALTDRGNGEFGIDTRVANTVSGTLDHAMSARAPLAAIFDAEKALAFRLLDQLGVTLTPAERAAIEQRPTSNVTAMLAYSRGVRDEAFGQYASAAANYRAAVVADPGFGAARTRLGASESAMRTSSTEGATTTTTTSGDAKEAKPSAATSNAVTLAGSTVNPSPVATVTAGTTATTTQQQQSQQSSTPPAPPRVLTTVIINVKQLP